jgi:hypothetical protein
MDRHRPKRKGGPSGPPFLVTVQAVRSVYPPIMTQNPLAAECAWDLIGPPSK